MLQRKSEYLNDEWMSEKMWKENKSEKSNSIDNYFRFPISNQKFSIDLDSLVPHFWWLLRSQMKETKSTWSKTMMT